MQDDASPLYQPGLPEILAQPIKAEAKAKTASRGSDGGEQGGEGPEPAPKAKAKAKGKPKAKTSRAETLKHLAELQGTGDYQSGEHHGPKKDEGGGSDEVRFEDL